MARPKNQELREFILRNIPEHAKDIVPYAVKTFGISRASVSLYIRDLVSEGLVDASGRTNTRQYQLKELDTYAGTFSIGPDLKEDMVLREYLSPRFKGLPVNIIGIFEYGFLEIMNNAIEHSEGTICNIRFSRSYARATLSVLDDGIGIFDKITRICKLENNREAILELSKGKLTTDSNNHSGEGIFFTSRMFDVFSIVSGGLRYRRSNGENNERLVEAVFDNYFISENLGVNFTHGTFVGMEISTDVKHTSKEIFDKYVDDDARFSRTHVPLTLARYEGEALLSRSQARRLLARVEKFSKVILDFWGIGEIGQAFADEIFRVWAREHPNVTIIPENASPDVQRMIRHAYANAAEQDAANGRQSAD
jgi:hypothetical protein